MKLLAPIRDLNGMTDLPAALGGRGERTSKLADRLGDAHDLAVCDGFLDAGARPATAARSKDICPA